jgi:PAS domain S-box-containing protein
MAQGQIILSSAGSLCVAVVALLFFIFQYRFYIRKPDYVWNGWGAVLSLCTCIYSLAVTVQFNTAAGPLNLFTEKIQYTCFIGIMHSAYGYTLAYLVLNSRWFHRLFGVVHGILIVLIWFTDLVIGDAFLYRDFLWLAQPYIEPALGPLGPACLGYLALGIVLLPALWLRHRHLTDSRAHLFFFGFAAWVILGVHDILGTLGVPTVQYLMEYGFLGFSVALLTTSVKNYGELEQMLAVEKDRLTVTIQALGEGFISTDMDGNVVLFNKEAERLCGWTRSRIIGKPLQEVYYVLNGVHRGQRTDLLAGLLDAGGSHIHYDGDVLISMDGREHQISQTLSLIQDGRGLLVGMVVIFRPVRGSS